MTRERIAAAGAGRMGRGIAVVFAYSGHTVRLVDLKPRDAAEFKRVASEARQEIDEALDTLCELGVMPRDAVEPIAARISIHAGVDALADADVIFEGVPETREAKQSALQAIATAARADAIIASTTSTMLSTELQDLVTHPARFLNAHWLNPAYLVPLVEVSPGARTDPAVVERLKTLLEGIGKVPVVCKASPGYIVPRIQALAMNEAARLVEEGVASAEDVDRAIKYGFGLRYAVLGLIEFIDWGGGDILYYASRYLREATGEDRFAAPKIVEDNMHAGRIGLRTGRGFYDFRNMDVARFKRERLGAYVALLRHFGLLRPPAG
ncbi:MAG: 3-hydroxybutyryl-CoA dehydrogenase [Betaproteobacteria bacterium]|jgi:3-hydroxybutyryl-CoA dehydrogenase|nr:3-hydroxybutyryl-CoA dehydrogenase [Betaproteobacteria bacterium]